MKNFSTIKTIWLHVFLIIFSLRPCVKNHIFIIFFFVLYNPVYAADIDYYAQGIKQLQMENYEESEPLLLKAYKKNPKDQYITYNLGILYKEMENFNESLRFFKETVKINPQLMELRYYLAQVLMMTGDYDGALTEFEEADKIKHYSMITFYRGIIYNQKGDYKRAMELIKSAGEEDSNLKPLAHYQLGLIAFHNGDYKESKAYFRSLITISPKSDEAEFARQYLSAIEKVESMRNWKITLGYSYQYDDNVVLKPLDTATAEGITDKSDWVSNLNFSFDYSKRLFTNGNIGLGYSFSHSLHSLFTAYDIQSHGVNILPAYSIGSLNMTLLYGYSHLFLDRAEYMKSHTVSPLFSYLISNGKHIIQASFKWQDKDFVKAPSSEEENRTGINYDAGAGYFLFFKEGKGYINAKYNYDRDSTKGSNWQYNGHKGALSILFPVGSRINFNLSGDGYYQRYDNIHSTYSIRREDTVYNANTLISLNILKDLRSDITYTYTRAFSNTAVYDYEKNSVSIGLNYIW